MNVAMTPFRQKKASVQCGFLAALSFLLEDYGHSSDKAVFAWERSVWPVQYFCYL